MDKKFKLLWLKAVIIGVALVAGIALWTLGVHYKTAQAVNNHVYPKNQYGQTYGSAADAESPETEPDLIWATGVDGTNKYVDGYVKRTDLEQPFPKTPEEAIALTKYNLANPTREIPLYDVDGKTVLGKFIIGGGTVKVFKTPENMQIFEMERQISSK